MIKKIIFAAIIFACGKNVSAQVINGGFENWTSMFGEPIEPQGWVTANIFRGLNSSNDTSVYKVGPPFNMMGNFSMKMRTIVLAANPDTTTIPDTIGIAMQGTLTLFPYKIYDRIPCTSRPGSIHFEAKYTPVGNDTGYCYVELSKWNTSLMRRDTIGAMWVQIMGGANPVVYTTPIYYYPNHMNSFPDSLALAFSSSNPYIPMPGSVLYADDIYFTGWNSVQDIYSQSSHVSAFPNPSREMITISTDITNASRVIIYDCIGKTIGTFLLDNNKFSMNTSGLMPGNYFYSVLGKNGAVLTGNTFTVLK